MYPSDGYFCIEDNVHTIVVNGSASETSEICFEFDDTSGDAFRGCAPIVDVFHTSSGEIYGAPSPLPTSPQQRFAGAPQRHPSWSKMVSTQAAGRAAAAKRTIAPAYHASSPSQ